MKSTRTILTSLLLFACGIASGATIPSLVTFDPPNFQQGPSIFVAVPNPQTFVTSSATFTGGVNLGFATFFPAISFATIPNVYGTANFGNHLSNTLTISVDPAFTTTEVSFALFNGETFNQSYTVNAFNGTSVVASQTLTNLAPNFNSGFGLVDLNSTTGITSVTISPTGTPAVWDFLIDTVAFNQNITSIITAPVPSSPLAATPPVQGHRHGQGEGETELVEVNFGDDINDIRGSVLVVTPNAPVNPPVVPVNPPSVPADGPSTVTPEPGSYLLVVAGLCLLAIGRWYPRLVSRQL